jgi:hypothetical protein
MDHVVVKSNKDSDSRCHILEMSGKKDILLVIFRYLLLEDLMHVIFTCKYFKDLIYANSSIFYDLLFIHRVAPTGERDLYEYYDLMGHHVEYKYLDFVQNVLEGELRVDRHGVTRSYAIVYKLEVVGKGDIQRCNTRRYVIHSNIFCINNRTSDGILYYDYKTEQVVKLMRGSKDALQVVRYVMECVRESDSVLWLDLCDDKKCTLCMGYSTKYKPSDVPSPRHAMPKNPFEYERSTIDQNTIPNYVERILYLLVMVLAYVVGIRALNAM